MIAFLFSKKHFSVEKMEVKFQAFIPKGTDISVYRISDLSEPEVWEIGRKYVQREGRSIKARADFFAKDVYENDLKVIPETTPHERHANITPFPEDKRKRDHIAKRLAPVSELVTLDDGESE